MNPQQQQTIARLQEALDAVEAAKDLSKPGRLYLDARDQLSKAANPTAIRSLLDLLREQEGEIARLQSEFDKRLRVSISQGDVIANHVIAMQSAVLEQHYGEGSIEAMNWIKNTLAGPGFLPSVEEAEAIPDPDSEGIAQAWFNAKTAEHEAFRAANPGPSALTIKEQK